MGSGLGANAVTNVDVDSTGNALCFGMHSLNDECVHA